MAEFPINWKLLRCYNIHSRTNCYTSNLKINADWSLLCIWSGSLFYNGPEYLEVRRDSTAGDILISGNLKLIKSGRCVVQRKFLQLIANDCEATLLDLNYPGKSDAYGHGYSITGTLSIPAKEGVQKECAKEIQKKCAKEIQKECARGAFDSLLELSREFECLLDSKATYFSDMNLKCGSVSFSVHKNILSVRSPVFAAMFTNKMKENQEKKVNITDISPHVLKTMLNYIYTGITGVLSFKTAGELLFAADKYQLKDLKRVCCDYLKSCVSVENVLKILVLGDFHDKCLKVFAMDFICKSSEEFEILEKTAEWKNLREQKPSLAMDVLTGLVRSNNTKLKR